MLVAGFVFRGAAPHPILGRSISVVGTSRLVYHLIAPSANPPACAVVCLPQPLVWLLRLFISSSGIARRVQWLIWRGNHCVCVCLIHSPPAGVLVVV